MTTVRTVTSSTRRLTLGVLAASGLAAALMAEHIGTVQAHLRLPAAADPLARLRDALAPMSEAGAAQDLRTRKRRKPLTPSADSSTEPSTYLGALL